MRIHSKYKEYYDGLAAADRGLNCVYVREHRPISVSALPFALDKQWLGLIDRWGNGCYQQFVVFFWCGRAYPVVGLKAGFGYESPKSGSLFSINEVDAWLKSKLKPGAYAEYMRPPRLARHARFENHHERKTFVEFFDLINAGRNRYYSQFLDAGMPAVLLRPRCTDLVLVVDCDEYVDERVVLELNPNLVKLGWPRMFGAGPAYQELSMFFGNRAEPRKRMPVISDELKAQTHGFDKHSFRNPGPRRVDVG